MEIIPVKTRWCKHSDFSFDDQNHDEMVTESGFYPVIK